MIPNSLVSVKPTAGYQLIDLFAAGFVRQEEGSLQEDW